ncbi:MAG TPA: hypothetical protein VKD90_02150 [Gemmataceae bacterium]|nr:hypothetical protein [Gemmataceae bacterium]
MSESTVERTIENAGAALGARLGHGDVFGEARPWAWSRDARGQSVGYLNLDATGVGIQGPNGTATEGRMVDVGLIFDPGSNGQLSRTRALAGLLPRADLGEQMRRQAGQVGLEATKTWVALTDGGAGPGWTSSCVCTSRAPSWYSTSTTRPSNSASWPRLCTRRTTVPPGNWPAGGAIS